MSTTTNRTSDTSEVLAAFPRGEREELRVCRNSYRGYPYLDVRLWSKDNQGRWISTGKGCTVRNHEVAGVVAALSGSPRPKHQKTLFDRSVETPEVEGEKPEDPIEEGREGRSAEIRTVADLIERGIRGKSKEAVRTLMIDVLTGLGPVWHTFQASAWCHGDSIAEGCRRLLHVIGRKTVTYAEDHIPSFVPRGQLWTESNMILVSPEVRQRYIQAMFDRKVYTTVNRLQTPIGRRRD